MSCLEQVLAELTDEYFASIKKHGIWEKYNVVDVHKAVADEFREYIDAVIAGNISGLHGQRAELLQLANVAIKGCMRLDVIIQNGALQS